MRFGLLLLLIPALVAAACGGGSVSPATPPPLPSGTPINTPTTSPTPVPGPSPTATPTPTGLSGSCYFIWETENGDGTYDFYEAFVAGSAWRNGSQTLDGVNLTTSWGRGYDPTSGKVVSAGMSVAGNISLTVTNTSIGTSAGFADLGGKTYYDATALFNGTGTGLGAVVGTGGAGAFAGVLSDPSPSATKTMGMGVIEVTTAAGQEGIGGSASPSFDFAYCAN